MVTRVVADEGELLVAFPVDALDPGPDQDLEQGKAHTGTVQGTAESSCYIQGQPARSARYSWITCYQAPYLSELALGYVRPRRTRS